MVVKSSSVTTQRPYDFRVEFSEAYGITTGSQIRYSGWGEVRGRAGRLERG